jgi:hypothetical protein
VCRPPIWEIVAAPAAEALYRGVVFGVEFNKRATISAVANLSDESTTVKAANEAPKSAALLGLAFDKDDDQTRITRGKNFLLLGGSQESHAVMQETAIKINEHLDKRGKRLEDASADELRAICHEVVK